MTSADENARLTEELRATREEIRHMLEERDSSLAEVKAMAEETLSSNEEFQSVNEELESGTEAQQAVNEELATTNDELRYRNREPHELQETISQARDYADAVVETVETMASHCSYSMRIWGYPGPPIERTP